MEWLDQAAALPLGGAVGAFVTLLVWLIRRGDSQTASIVSELRRQRDEALDREQQLRSSITELRDENYEYRRRYGPLAEDRP